tara:strand:+ start:716 stop:1519 length:804 start_codon:yes stop_codon:yes gene_type:complete
MTTPDLTSFDVLLLNSSAGKDSQTMIDEVVKLADAAGVRDRIVVVHCDLGRAEWEGTADLAKAQADHYGLRFEIVRRPQGDLLAQIEARGMFPSSAARYCTSDQKTGQVARLMTQLVKEQREALGTTRRIRILNMLGIRAQESSARAKKEALGLEKKASNGKREVVRWLPIFDWTEDEVWASIKATGVPYHAAYDAGMPRLSCAFCVLASRSALVLSAQLNPALAQQYVELEERIDHRFTNTTSMAEIVNEAKTATAPVCVENWGAC